MLNKYESIYIINPEVDAEGIKGLVEKFNALIESEGGKVTETNEWGMKKLAYPINFKNDGYYVLMNLEAEANVPQEVQKQLNITADVYRAMFVRK